MGNELWVRGDAYSIGLDGGFGDIRLFPKLFRVNGRYDSSTDELIFPRGDENGV